jgi:hypothetical protein
MDEDGIKTVSEEGNASSGHALGQIVGDWFQDYFVQPLLLEVSRNLGLYLDYRLNNRNARGAKINWKDDYGNVVDYDFVMEIGGTNEKIGVPVAFLECFWRRGSRHSKDKARDDSGKLYPMRDVYPTARFLGIIAGGDFTKPAIELVKSRNIDLFCILKSKIVETFSKYDITIDYSDKEKEENKIKLLTDVKSKLNGDIKIEVAKKLRDLIGAEVINSYTSRVYAALSALPQEIRIYGSKISEPKTFEDIDQVQDFLNFGEIKFEYPKIEEGFRYEISYNDGEFIRYLNNIEELKKLNEDIKLLVDHIKNLKLTIS